MPPPGLQLSPSRNMAFHYIGLLSMTPWLCNTDGLPQISRLSATTATISLMNMHSHVLKEVFPPLGTMKSEILRPISSQKYVARCALNSICSQLRHTNCGRFEKYFLMCVSSTLMPPPTRTRRLLPVTESMRRRKNELMNRRYATRLLLHLFSQPQEEWEERQPVSTNDWPPCLLRSGIIHTAPHFGG